MSPRAVLNRLQIVDPLKCISDLNLFERTLIKFCMTCVTIIRLGQISNTAQRQKELNSALKCRLAAYWCIGELKFVAGKYSQLRQSCADGWRQPTRKKRYLEVCCRLMEGPCRTRLPAREEPPLHRRASVFCWRLPTNCQWETNAWFIYNARVRTFIAEEIRRSCPISSMKIFTVQPLSCEFPADIILDYQLDKVHGNNVNIFDTDFDLKKFPRLFSTDWREWHERCDKIDQHRHQRLHQESATQQTPSILPEHQLSIPLISSPRNRQHVS